MGRAQESIDVNVPIRIAYNQWTQFEEFPRFMEGIKEVRQIDDQRLLWRAEIAGKDKEWEAKIVEQIPDTRIAWTSTNGAHNAGVVTFHRLDEEVTRVELDLEYEPEGIIESTGDALGIVRARIKGDLERFKEFVESRGHETGQWRGEIRHGEVRENVPQDNLEQNRLAGRPLKTNTGQIIE